MLGTSALVSSPESSAAMQISVLRFDHVFAHLNWYCLNVKRAHH